MPPRTASISPRPRTRTVPAQNIAAAQAPTDEQIRMRAYEIYVSRGGAPGNATADWLQAEQELRGRLTLLGKT
jgi:hypothetical protein